MNTVGFCWPAAFAFYGIGIPFSFPSKVAASFVLNNVDDDFTNCPSAIIIRETRVKLLDLKLAHIMMGITLVITLAMMGSGCCSNVLSKSTPKSRMIFDKWF